MNFKLTASILVVMLALLAVVIFLRHQSSSHPQQTHGALFSVSKSPVTALSFSAKGRPTLHFVKRGAHWYILSPRKAWGRDFAIGELCDQISSLKYHFRVPIASSGRYTLAKLGLKPARASLILTRADGKKLALQIGRSTLGGRLYVATNNHFAAVVRRTWLRKLFKGESHFATKSLTRFHAAAVESITLKRGKTELRIIRHGKGWVINAPLLARANPTKVTNWISNLQILAAHKFASAKDRAIKHLVFQAIVKFRKVPSVVKLPDQKAAKIPPPLVVSFGSYTDLTHQFIHALSNANPNLAIVRSTSFSQLERSLTHFQDRALTRAPLTTATSVLIHLTQAHPPLAPASLQLIRHGTGWKMGTTAASFDGGPLLAARKAAVAKLLKNLSAIRAKSFNNAPPPKLAHFQPVGTLSITLPHRLHPVVISFGAGDKGGLSPVKVKGWKTIYMVSTVRVATILPSATALRSHTVANVPAVALRRLVLQQNGKILKLAKTKNGWVIQPGAKPISQVDVASFTAELSPIRCHKWLTNPPKPAHATELRIYYQATFHPEGKGKPPSPATASISSATIRIWSTTASKPLPSKQKGKGSKTEKTYYAQWLSGRSQSSPWVFSPSQSLVAGIRQIAADGNAAASEKK